MGGTALKILGYSLFVDVVAWFLITAPVHALTYSSTGYVRVMNQASQLAYLNANRAALISTVASAVAAPTPASVAIRMVTGPVGWSLLGVAAGVALMQTYYNQSSAEALKAAAAIPVTVPGATGTFPANAMLSQPCTGTSGCTNGTQDQSIRLPGTLPPGTSGCILTGLPTLPSGWTAWGNSPAGDGGCTAYHTTSATGTAAVAAHPANSTEVSTYVNALPANSPLSLESHTTPLGQGALPDTGAVQQVTPVSTAQAATQVVPQAQVTSGDAVINPNAAPPAGTTTTTTHTQTDTSTTTTTSNPNGSVTSQTDTSTTASCSSGNHDQRTMATVLQSHMDTWKGSGIAGQLSLLQNLTWPTTYPTYSVQSTLFGTFSFDFSQWAGVLTALRTLIIAASSFVAYRIIFVGGT